MSKRKKKKGKAVLTNKITETTKRSVFDGIGDPFSEMKPGNPKSRPKSGGGIWKTRVS